LIACGSCKSEIDWDEYVINFGWCNRCFDESYEQYMEEIAGPYDWLEEPK